MIATIPGIRRFQIKEMGSDVMASSAAPIQVLVFGKNPQTIADLGNGVADIARKTPGMFQVATGYYRIGSRPTASGRAAT